MARKRRYTMSRNPFLRAKLWEAKMKPDIYKQQFEAVKDMALERVLDYQVLQEYLIKLVRGILAKYGKDTYIMQEYMWFAEKLWRLTQTYKDLALQKEADSLFLYYLVRGRDEQILRDIAKALGVNISDTQDIIRRIGIEVGVTVKPISINEGLDPVIIDNTIEKLIGEVKPPDNAKYLAYVDGIHVIIDSSNVIMGYIREITITNNTSQDLTDYVIRLDFNANNFDFTKTQPDGSDIYFLDENGNPLYYWIEKWDTQNKIGLIWVKVPSIPANSTVKIKMCYGSNNPYQSYNDPTKVFLFFEDFEEYELNKPLAGQDGWVSETYGNAYSQGEIQVTSDAYHGSKGITSSQNASELVKKTINLGLKNFELRFFIKYLYYGNTEAIVVRDSNGNMVGAGINPPTSTSGNPVYATGNDTWASFGTSISYPSPWMEVIVRFYNNKYVLVKVGSQQATNITYPSTFGGIVDVAILDRGQTAQASFDLVMIRKYVDPEPTVTIGDEIALSIQLNTRITALLDDGSEVTLKSYNLSIATKIDEWIRYIYSLIPTGRTIKAIRIYAYIQYANPPPSYPTVQLERVTGIAM